MSKVPQFMVRVFLSRKFLHRLIDCPAHWQRQHPFVSLLFAYHPSNMNQSARTFMSVCSMTRSRDTPAQYRSLMWITNRPALNISYIYELVVSSSFRSCKYTFRIASRMSCLIQNTCFCSIVKY